MKLFEVLDVFKNRCACEKYDPSKKISDESWEMLMEAHLSANSFGFEP